MTEELNRRHNLATIPTINNNGESYIVPFDIYKEGYDAYDISNWFKGRVGDNGTPFGIRWYKHGQLMDVTGMRPFIEGQVGDYTIDDSDPDDPKIIMDSEASNVHVVGEVNDCQEYGVAIYRLINQAMPQSGIFYGKIGVMGTQDDGTTVMSSVDVVFKVLAGHMNMLGARKFYVTELEKAWLEMQSKIKQYNQEYKDATTKQAEQFKEDTEKALADLNTKIANEIKRAEDTLGDTQAAIDANIASLKTLASTTGSILDRIKAEDIVTKKENEEMRIDLSSQITDTNKSLTKRLANMDNGVHGYPNADAIKAAYPNGKDGIFVAIDTGHQWYFDNGWKDGGSYQSQGLTPLQEKQLTNTFIDVLVIGADPKAINCNDLENGKSYVALDGRDPQNQLVIQGLNYPPVTDLYYGVMETSSIQDGTGSVQVYTYSQGTMMRYKLNGIWSAWNRSFNKFKSTIVINDTKSTADADELTSGNYFIAIDGNNNEVSQHATNDLHFPKVNSREVGMLDVTLIADKTGGAQILYTQNAIYFRTKAGIINDGKWTDWQTTKVKDPTQFKSTIAINDTKSTVDADELTHGRYFIAIDGRNSEVSQHATNDLHFPNINRLETGVFYSDVDDTFSGIQRYITQNAIYFRSKAGIINDGKWTNWATFKINNSNNKAVFLGDSRMAGLQGTGGYSIPYPFQVISKENGWIPSGQAVSGTGFKFTIDGTNADTTSQSINFKNYDIAVIAYGINDYLKDQPLGAISDTEDTDSVIGKMLKITKKIYNDNPLCKVIYVLPFVSANRGDESTRFALDFKNNATKPYSLNMMQESMASFCEKYEIPYVDTRKGCPINPLNVKKVLADGLHPSTNKEYLIYETWLAGQLSSLSN